ncbi:armadillo-type protein [Scheffersomyces coipomensis]|uniref:armadillo-type protein n=1 Tax=Scheffersomyces coipomensis TaxID=1788519 RepID=UPI00315CD3EB
MNILEVLEHALFNRDPNKRTEAELQLNEAANNYFEDFVTLLIDALINEEAKTEVRMLAGLFLKNQLTSKDTKTKLAQQARWINLSVDYKSGIKSKAIQALETEDEKVASSAAQLVAAIADIELPRNEWSELIPTIINNTKAENKTNVKKASHLAIGYICESADPLNPAIIAQASGILIAIVQGVQSSEPKVVRLTALNALVNSLAFIKNNFENEGERNYIMQVVCEATQADDPELQASAFGCLSRIMATYYRYMSLYMEKALYGLTVSGMQSNDERVACMAVEFWSTVCEDEIESAMARQDAGLDSVEAANSADLITFNFALVALQDVLPTLLTLLTRQHEDPEDDDWSVAMAAGSCLALFANNVQNYVTDPTLQFVSANIGSENWREREAAVMAFGSILDGPEHDQLRTVVAQALEPILLLIGDSSLQVKETVAWCLGRITDLLIDSIDVNTQLPTLLEALVSGLQDHPKVSTNCCWTLINIWEQLCVDSDKSATSFMSQYYPNIVPILMQLTNREDNEFSSRTSAFETLSTIVSYSANDTIPIVQSIANDALTRLEATISMQSQISSNEDRGNLEELQSNILNLLTKIIGRLGQDVTSVSDSLLSMFLKLLAAQEANSLIEEDILFAIATVAGSIGGEFVKYMDAFLPYLSKALQNTDSTICNAAIGIVADLAQSLGVQIVPYLEGLMTILGSNLNNAEVRKELRPLILSCFGDVAAAIGNNFNVYTSLVIQICELASQLEPENGSIEALEYVVSVKEAVLDCYVGIVGGLNGEPQFIYPHIGSIFSFIQRISVDYTLLTIESVCRSATGLLGDIAAMFPNGEFKDVYTQPWVTDLIKKTRSNPNFDHKTKEAARWARDQQKRQISLQG